MNNVLRHFRSLHSNDGPPGSLGGGISRGYFWESDFPNFQTTEQLEDWINKRAGEFSGYYPRCFELAAMQMANEHSTKFESMLLEKMQKDLGADESEKAIYVIEA
ncbi:hypothetical protein TWF481_010814 [Arthrobotrys musiformis]|uniref:Uncharacterized protein n=1 Tax=Arthrobotrys musiformis TaxID=47236 RepID=A0AAV9W1X4_9PEZI